MPKRRRWRELARGQQRLASSLSFHDETPGHKERNDPLREIDEFQAFLRALGEADTRGDDRLGRRR